MMEGRKLAPIEFYEIIEKVREDTFHLRNWLNIDGEPPNSFLLLQNVSLRSNRTTWTCQGEDLPRGGMNRGHCVAHIVGSCYVYVNVF